MGHFGGDASDGGQFWDPANETPIYQTGPLPIVWPIKMTPRSDFDPVEMNRLIWNYGLPALWEPWIPCPCGHSQAASTDCPLCLGTGRYYFTQQEVFVVNTSNMRDWKQFDRMGPIAPGTANFIVRGEHVPAFGDRLTLHFSHIPLNLMATRRAPLADPEADPPIEAIETLLYPVVPQIIELRKEDGGTETRSIGVMHMRGQKNDGTAGDELVEGVDFDVTETGKIDWAKGDMLGSTPRPGKFFSIYYRTRPVYRVETAPVAVRDTQSGWKKPEPESMVMPVEFTGKLEWMVEQT